LVLLLFVPSLCAFPLYVHSFPTRRSSDLLIASTVIVLDVSRSFSRVLQARRLRPLMRMASEPHTPWAQDRRKDSEPSISHLISCRASTTLLVALIVVL